MAKAFWYRTAAPSEEVTPKNGKRFTLEELQGFVGGLVELVTLKDGRQLWLNEEGKLNKLKFNSIGTRVWQDNFGKTDVIVGDILLCDPELTADENGEK